MFEVGQVSFAWLLFLLYMLHDLLDFCFINLGRVHSFRLRDSLLSVVQPFPFRIAGEVWARGSYGKAWGSAHASRKEEDCLVSSRHSLFSFLTRIFRSPISFTTCKSSRLLEITIRLARERYWGSVLRGCLIRFSDLPTKILFSDLPTKISLEGIKY